MIKRTALCASLVTTLLLTGTFGCDSNKKSADDKKAQSQSPKESKPGAKAKGEEKGSAAHSAALPHLPKGCQLVFSLDLKKAQTDPLVAKHLKFPTREELDKHKGEADADELAAAKAMEALGVKSAKQIHSVAACITSLDDKTGEPKSFSLAVGGEFKKVSDLDLIAQTSGGSVKGKRSKVKIAGIDAVKNEEEGMLFAQAKDGALVMSNDEALLKESFTASDSYKSYNVSDAHHLSLLVKAALAEKAAASGGAESPFSQIHPGDMRFHGSLSGKLNGEIEMKTAAEANQAVALIEMLKKQFSMHPDPTMKKSIRAISIRADAAKLVFDINLPEDVAIEMLESYSKMSAETQKNAK